MSIKVMTMVWDVYPASGSELIAMLAMADWCDDRGGSLYPSMSAVAEKIRVSEKQARRIVQSIVERGFIRVVGNASGGKPGTTKQFQIEVGKLRELVLMKDKVATAPASVTPPIHGSPTPPMGVRDPSHGCLETPPTHGSLTVIEPSIEPSKGEKPAQAQATHLDVPTDLLNDFLALRKEKKAGPLTKTAIAGLQREADKAGISLEAAVTACCEYGWQGFNAGWYVDRTTAKSPAVITSNRQRPAVESFAERDARAGRERWEAMTGRQWPADELPSHLQADKPAPMVFDLPDLNTIRRIEK